MPLSQFRPHPRFLDGIDGFLDAQLEHSANSADNVPAVVVASEPWVNWQQFTTPFGHAVYLKSDLRFSPHRLLLTFSDHRKFAWSLHGITVDGTVVLVMHGSTDPPEPMAYVVGRPPYRRYNMNFAGCLRMGLILMFSGTLLALGIGFLSTFF